MTSNDRGVKGPQMLGLVIKNMVERIVRKTPQPSSYKERGQHDYEIKDLAGGDYDFLSLTDTPDTFGTALNLYRINAGKTALEEVAPASLGLGTSVPITTAGPAVTITTTVQTIGYIAIVPEDGTITYMAIYASQWTPDLSTDEITVTLYVNGGATDTFTNSSGTAGVKSGTISQAVAQGDYIAFLVNVTTQNAGLDVIKVTSASCNLSAVVL